jgi:uncharacterized membrane protein YeaQ/YmgE (transglycosylase-associated protein family)
MQVDPKISMWLNIVVAVLGALMGASAQLTTIFGQGKAQAIISLCGLVVAVVGAVNSALHGVSSAQSGPLAKDTPNA